jgi:hypothetical protein
MIPDLGRSKDGISGDTMAKFLKGSRLGCKVQDPRENRVEDLGVRGEGLGVGFSGGMEVGVLGLGVEHRRG